MGSKKAGKLTWDELLDEYFFSRNLRPDTEWSYRKVVRGFVDFMGEEVFPADVTQPDIQRWRRQVLKTQSLSTYTWNNKVAHLRAIFGFGIKKGLLPHTENPLCEASVAKEAKKKKTLNKDQMIQIYLVVQKFAEYETQQRVPCDRRRNALYPARYWLTVLDVLRYTGMRFNQLQHIRLKDVRPGEGVIELQLEGSKTHREWGVPIVTPLKAPLELLLSRARCLGAGSDDFLFDVCRFTDCIEPDKYEYCPARAHQAVKGFFRRLSRECGFLVSAHRFRHTLATVLMESPERNMHLVKSLLGHQSIVTTMEYVDVSVVSTAEILEVALGLYTDTRTVSEVCKEGENKEEETEN
ncbi:site-specific integrase [Escherichia coli]|nr:site-specific integrase [Escherichia coli]MDF1125937.1 site-specific integrase [Escherichia coli]